MGICIICAVYQRWHKVLPDASALAGVAQRIEARENAGSDAACGTCGILESQLPEKPLQGRNGEEKSYDRKHRVHLELPGKLLCEQCYHFFGLYQREKTDEEAADYLNSHFLVATRKQGGTIRCENPNCNAVEGSKDCAKKNHVANRRVRKVLCRACDGYERAYPNTLRSRKQVGTHLLENRLKEDRSAKRPIFCENSVCNAPEEASQKKNHAVNIEANMVLWPTCNSYLTRYGQHRPAEAVQLHLKQIQMDKDRKDEK